MKKRYIVDDEKLLSKWNFKKNHLTPDQITTGSGKKVWWICEKGHDYEATVSDKSRGRGCPICSGRQVLKGFNDLESLQPDLAKQWHPIKNEGMKPSQITSKSGKKVWWICEKGHEWETSVSERTRGYGCPYCSGRYVIPGENDLETLKPELAKQWHPGKNGTLLPSQVMSQTSKKVWWICEKGHEWEAKVQGRFRGDGCPYCSGRYVTPGENDLETLNLELAKQWHPYKNGELLPSQVANGTHVKVWWMCNKGHEWKTSVDARTGKNGTGCPYCSGKKVVLGENDFKTNFLEIANEWHPTKNKDLLPSQFLKKSNVKVWWICDKGHEWKAALSNRATGRNCPECYADRRISFSEKVVFYYVKLVFPDTIENYKPNFLAPKELDIYIPSLNFGIEYDGQAWHKDNKRDLIKDKICYENNLRLIRIREPNCKKLNSTSDELIMSVLNNDELENKLRDLFNNILGVQDIDINIERDTPKINELMKYSEKANSIAEEFPLLSKQWHYKKNSPLNPSQIPSNSNRKYWWICDKGHEWKAVVSNRTLFNRGCPYCSGRKAIQGETDLGTKFPEISKWWNHERNHPLLPSQFKPQSNKKVWWQCDEGHEWEAAISSRFRNKGCPICSGRKILKGFNDLLTLNPKLAKEWHPNKNGELQPTQFTLGSDKKIWWQCDKGHEWEAKVDQRSRQKSGCPYCSGNRVIIGETDLATLMPELSTQWHPTKNLNLSPSQIKKSSNKKVWWLCDKGHEWKTSVGARTGKNGTGCPYCSGQRVAVGENDLATVNPKLAKEWHPYKNGDLTPNDVTKGSDKKVWWVCKIGHEWESRIANRNNGNGCPHCRKAKLNK